MSQTLTSNVHVGGKWYGPDYPQNAVTSDVLKQITNEAAFADPAASAGYGDNRTRADDFADGSEAVDDTPDGPPESPPPFTRTELEAMHKDDLFALAEELKVEVNKSATKDELVDALAGEG